MKIVVWVLAAVGALVTALNFYLSFVRVPLHRLRHDGALGSWFTAPPP